MTPRERVLAALRRQRLAPVPVGALTPSATRAQMDAIGIYWPNAHLDAPQMAALAGAARTLLGFEIVRVPFDQTLEAELFGADVSLGDESSVGSVRSHPFRLDQPLPPIPDFSSGRAGVVAEAIGILKRQTGDGAAVIGGLVGPFTLVCQLAGLSEAVMTALRKPSAVRPWLDLAVEAGLAYARRLVAAGADAICVEDMSASLDLTSPGIYRSLILPAHQRLIAAIPAPVILHVCGSNTRILELLCETGADALSLESKTDLASAVSLRACAIAGGVDPVQTLLNGTPEDVRRACIQDLAAGVHILAPGCGLAPDTPTANLQEMVRAAREYVA
jgi:[methyl-Co(III) methanol-specific corrinoid protein]:coenzyme M methyltransferase